MDVMGWHPDNKKPVTLKDLVQFEGAPSRLPPVVVDILSQLYRQRDLLGRARVVTGEENGQKTLDIHLKLQRHSRTYRYGYGYDAETDIEQLYEGIEGTGSERLLVRAHIREIEGPVMRFLMLDESELLPTDGLDAAAYAEEEEAWLLTTEEEVLGEYAEEIHSHLDAWAEQHEGRPQPQYLRFLRDKDMVNLQAIQMPLDCTLAQAREFAGLLGEALGLTFTVQLAPRHAERRRQPGDVYETARDMARRLRGKV